MKARKLETMAPCVANKAESLCRELPVERHVSRSNTTFQHGQLLLKLLEIFFLAGLRLGYGSNVLKGLKGWKEYVPKNPSPLTVFIKQSPELL